MAKQVKKLTLKMKLIFSFGFLLLILNFFGLIFLISTTKVREQFGFVIEKDEPVIANANRLLRLVVDMETGERGFCITKNDVFLEPYYKGRKEFQELLDVQKELVSDNPNQLMTLNNIHKLVNQWFEEAALPEITRRREMPKESESLAAVIELINEGTGKRLIDKVREEFASFIKIEEEIARSRYAQASEMVGNTKNIVITLMALCSIFGAGLAAVTIRSITKPVSGLLEGTKIIGAGDLAHRIKVMQNDEIGELTKSFNEMVHKRQQAENELIKHRYHLEEQVKDRTAKLEHELTERKHTEESLRESEKKYRILFEQSADATLIIEGDKFTDCNQTTVKMLGYSSKKELIETHPAQLSPQFQPDGRSSFEKANEMMSIAFEQGTHRFEWYHKRKNGEVFPVEVLLTAVKQADRDFLHVVWRDITDRKLAEKAIKESEKQLRSIADYTYDWESWFAPDGQLMWVNPAVEKLTGYSLDECKKMPDYPLPIVLDDDRPQFERSFRQALKEQSSLNDSEFRILHKNGSVQWMAISWQPIYDDRGQHIGQRTSVRDISDRKQAEEQREILVKSLEYKNKELQDIVYTASHDLRSPLVNIEGFSGELDSECNHLMELLKELSAGVDKRDQIEQLIKEDIPQSLGFIKNGAKKMSSLLDGLLQISRIGTVEIHSEPLDMDKLVKEILASMLHQIKKNNVSVTVDSLPCCKGDLHMLDHVFTNLISNAIKYRDPAKKSEIKIYGKEEGDMSIYCVEDNGIGIAPSYQKKVFEIFHRLNPLDPASGEGLGLTIVTRVMDRLEGKIWLESEPGKGSKFFISLPKK